MRKHLLALPLAAAFASPSRRRRSPWTRSTSRQARRSPGPGLAVHGHDVVAYFADGTPTAGSDEFAHVYDGATYRFASRANLDAFKADPAKYAPAYGGFCAYGVAVGKKFDGDPRFWKMVDGRL
jgi:YHS domain-containing protein